MTSRLVVAGRKVDEAGVARLTFRFGPDDGFTLVELLVAILIVGILAAIAIPAFVGAESQANDAPAKEMAAVVRRAAETLGLDNGGSYATITKANLHGYEPAIASTNANVDAYLSAASGTATGYTLTVKAVATGDKFTISRAADGTLARTCTIPARGAPHGGCESVKGTKGSW